MRVLILDDDTERHEGFDAMLVGHEVVHCYSGASFRAWYQDKPFDLVCFDHDLDATETGYDAALDFVADAHPRCTCLIHSWNPDGALRISRLLRKAGHLTLVAPFGLPLKGLLDGVLS